MTFEEWLAKHKIDNPDNERWPLHRTFLYELYENEKDE